MSQPAFLDGVRRERRRLRVEDFELLADSGAFVDCGKTELIDVMNAQWARQGRIKSRLAVALANRLAAIGSDLEAMVETSVRVADDSMPEPDIVLTSWRGERAVPGDTVSLIIEVADTALVIDLGRKAALYAAAAIPEYWTIDIDARCVIVQVEPHEGQYMRKSSVPFGQRITASTIADLVIATDMLIF